MTRYPTDRNKEQERRNVTLFSIHILLFKTSSVRHLKSWITNPVIQPFDYSNSITFPRKLKLSQSLTSATSDHTNIRKSLPTYYI